MRLAIFGLAFLAACTSTLEPVAPTDGGVGVDVGSDGAVDGAADASVDASDGALDGSDAVLDVGAPDAEPGDASSGDGGECDLEGFSSELPRYSKLVECLRSNALPQEKAPAIGRFLTLTYDGTGLPIVEDGRLVFAYWANLDPEASSHGAPLRVAGDFNAWDPSATPMLEESLGFFHVSVAYNPATNDRTRYKLVADDGGDVYFVNPLARRHDYDGQGRISIVRGGRGQGHLEDFGPFSTMAISSRMLTVYLPPGYEQGASPRPVLYLHDGNNVFSGFQPNSAPVSWEADEIFEEEIAAGTVEPFIAVAIPNSPDRFDEYTQTTDDIGGGAIGGRASDYEYFVTSVLKPAVDQRYRTRPGPESTAILGSSLGGLVSYYLGLQRPDLFGCVAGMSSTFAWGTIGLSQATLLDDYEAANLAGRNQKFYLDSGGGPGAGGDCSDGGADNYCPTVAMRDILIAKGFDVFPDDPGASPLTPAGVEILHWWTPDASHNEAAWHARIFRALRLCFPP